MEVRNIPLPGGEALWVRLYLPPLSSSSSVARRSSNCSANNDSLEEGSERMPVVLYAHGGAYSWGQPDWLVFHRFCATMALLSRSIWISLAYRLAPAYRLPAQFEDGFAALMWLRAHAHRTRVHGGNVNDLHESPHAFDDSEDGDPQQHLGKERINIDQGLARAADFSRVFLAGESAGATIMLHVAMRAADMDVSPLRIRGLMLIHPGFHTEAKREIMEKGDGNVRVAAGLQQQPSLTQMYEAALPEGEDLDYPGINPLSPRAPPLTPLRAYPHILLCVADGDLRRDLSLRFYDALRRICPTVDLLLTPLKGHVFHLFDPDCPDAVHLHSRIAQFLLDSTHS